jgi:hypothetical protein
MRTESLFYSLSLVACKHSETICRYCDSVACGLTSVACGPIFSQSSYEAKPCLPFAYLIPRRVLQQCCSFSLPHLQRVCRSQGCIVTASPSRRSFSTLSSAPPFFQMTYGWWDRRSLDKVLTWNRLERKPRPPTGAPTLLHLPMFPTSLEIDLL